MQRRYSWPLLALLALTLAAFAPLAAAAQELPPRPTPVASPDDDGDDADTPATGSITGTVIDQTTGAPAAGVSVLVGDVTVVSDRSGNYGRDGLPPDSYRVALALPAERGVASQGEVVVDVAAGARVVQHLAFRSPMPEARAVAPEAPAALPRTGGEASGSLALLALALLAGGAGSWLRRRR